MIRRAGDGEAGSPRGKGGENRGGEHRGGNRLRVAGRSAKELTGNGSRVV
jgi:hypothetical protein